MERVGSGIRFMISKMREYGLPAPEFKETDTEFAVTFYREQVTASSKPPPEITAINNDALEIAPEVNPGLSNKTDILYSRPERREMALEYVRTHGSISHKEYRTLTGASETTAIRDLAEMVSNGIVRRIGDGPRRRYVM